MSRITDALVARWRKRADDLTYDKGADPLDKALKTDRALLAKPDNDLVAFITKKIKPLMNDPALPPDRKEMLRQAFLPPSNDTGEMMIALLWNTNDGKSGACGKTSTKMMWELAVKKLRKQAATWKKYLAGEYVDIRSYQIFSNAAQTVDYERQNFLRGLMGNSLSEAAIGKWSMACAAMDSAIRRESLAFESEAEISHVRTEGLLEPAIKRIEKAGDVWIAAAEDIADDYCGLPRTMLKLRDELDDVLGQRNKVYDKLSKSSAFSKMLMDSKKYVLEDADKHEDHDPQHSDSLTRIADKLERLYHEFGMALNKWLARKLDLWNQMFDFGSKYEALMREAGYKR